MTTAAALAPNPVRKAAADAAWSQLLATGPVLTASRRRSVIAAARSAWAGEPFTTAVEHANPADATTVPLTEAAYWLAVDAGGINEDVVADFEQRGLDRWQYLETVGIVARLANIDFYARGLGAPLPALPDDDNADDNADDNGDNDAAVETPTGNRHPDANRAYGFVPVVGKARAPFVLDALPSEGEQLRALHEPMYLPFGEIMNADYVDAGATKAQIEYVASRVSYLNECFY